MNDDGIHPDQFEQDDVPGKAVFELFLCHGIAAIFDHDGFTVKFLNVRQRFR